VAPARCPAATFSAGVAIAAQDVVHRHRALAPGGGPAVHQDDRRAPLLQQREALVVGGHRGDQDALYPVLFQQLQIVRFLHLLVVAVAKDHGQAGLARLVLDAAGHVGEERVRHVQHDQADRAAAPGAQLTGRLVPDEAELLDGGADSVPCWLGDDVRPVQHVGDSPHRDARMGGDLSDARRRVCHVPSPDVVQVCGARLERVKRP
jgi:hypothetical protein